MHRRRPQKLSSFSEEVFRLSTSPVSSLLVVVLVALDRQTDFYYYYCATEKAPAETSSSMETSMQLVAGEDTLYSFATIYCVAGRFGSSRSTVPFEIKRPFDACDKSQELSHSVILHAKLFRPLRGESWPPPTPPLLGVVANITTLSTIHFLDTFKF